MRVVTGSEMREFDRITIEEIGIRGTVLMEEAGRGAAEEIVRCLEAWEMEQSDRFRPASQMRQRSTAVLIFAGKGNNGGDGFVIHRWLTHWGYRCTTVLLAPSDSIKGDARVNLEILHRLQADVREVLDVPTLQKLALEIDRYTLVVDAIFGTGLAGNVEGLGRAAIELINEAQVPVVAIDIPSGLDAVRGVPLGVAVEADLTVTFALPKLGLLLDAGQKHTGEVKVIDIGIPDKVVDRAGIQRFWVNDNLCRQMLPPRPADGHKGTFGRVFLLAGSIGLTGAAALAGEGALRSGAGLVTLGIPASLNGIMEIKLTEVMTKPLAEEAGHLSRHAIPEILEEAKKADVVAVGPGVGQSSDMVEIMEALLSCKEIPLVIDADGLNNLKPMQHLLKGRQALTVLTPHPGEMARLVDKSVAEVLANRPGLADSFAREHGVVLVLKGAPTITAMPDGRMYINSTGNEGMGTGGSGDVLTGLISGFMAQRKEDSSVPAAVYVHGLAGDQIAFTTNHRSMIAGDLLQGLALAFSQLEIIHRR